jgi:SAM-dependent methyltransferase
MNSFRRELLDQSLEKYKPLMTGRVMDIGGKKVKKRGSFTPPLKNVKSWEYLNSDDATNPDYSCNAENIPLRDGSINTVIMTEVLEYLPNPHKVFAEIHRILTDNGHVLVSTPFLNPVHGDHWADRARYTPVMLNEIIDSVGLNIKSIRPMGSVGAVLFDILRVTFGYASEKRAKPIIYRILLCLRPLFKWIDINCSKQSKYINTGYFLVIVKGI